MLLCTPAAVAQVEYDGILSGGSAGQTPALVTVDGIDTWVVPSEEGTLATGGRATNLFHGFQRMRIPADRGVLFEDQQSLAIDHLIVRVQDREGLPALIEGRFASSIPGASLFLLSSDGILMGPEADLSADGALHVSTADALIDDEGNRFAIDDTPGSELLSGVPVGVEFGARSVESDAGFDLFVRGEMNSAGRARPGLGEDPGWDGRIHLSGRRVRLEGTAGGVVVEASPQAGTPAEVGSIQIGAVGGAAVTLPLELSSFSSREAALGAEALVEAEGRFSLDTRPDEDGWGGRVVLRGGALRVLGNGLTESSVLVRGGQSVSGQPSGDPPPALDLEFAESILLAETIVVSRSDGDSPVEEVGALRLEAPEIELRDAVLWSDGLGCASAAACADGADIELVADRIDLLGAGTSLVTSSVGPNAAGEIRIQAEEEVLIDGSEGESSGFFETGLYAQAASSGDAGRIRLEARRIDILDDVQLSVSTDGTGDAGRVELVASEQIGLDGRVEEIVADQRLPGLYARAGTSPNPAPEVPIETGAAGTITIAAPEVRVENGFLVSVANNARGGGGGGRVAFDVRDRLSLAGEARVDLTTATFESDVGSTFSIDNTASAGRGPALVEIVDGASIGASTSGRPAAAAIAIQADRIVLARGGEISSESTIAANGGDAAEILLEAAVEIALREGSRIRSTSRGLDVAPGSIRLESGNRIEISGGSSILARAIRQQSGLADRPGNGAVGATTGNVVLDAEQEVRIEDSEISTFTRRAETGDVEITSSYAVTLFGSRVGTEVARDDGEGGDIRVSAPIVLLNASELSADAAGASADAGDLLLDAPVALTVDARSVLSADPGQLGVAGVIVLRSPDNDLFSSLEIVTEALDDPVTTIVDPCDVSRNDQGSLRIGAQVPSSRSPESSFVMPRVPNAAVEGAAPGCRGR